MTNSFQKRFDKEFIYSPGSHLLVIGQTGSGKTQFLIWTGTRLISLTGETVVWLDLGKKTESFFIPQWLESIKSPIKTKIIHPLKGEDDGGIDQGCHIEKLPGSYEIDPFDHVREIWDKVEKDKFNIISIKPFIIDPYLYTDLINDLISDLQRKVHNYFFEEEKEIKALTLIFDELHEICPGAGHLLTPEQNKLGALIQYNLEKMRSYKVRILGSTHGETKIRKGVRIGFNWRVYRRTSEKIVDIERLKSYQEKIQQLKIDEAMVVFPTKEFEIIKLGEMVYPAFSYNIRYKGIYTGRETPIMFNPKVKRNKALQVLLKIARKEWMIPEKILAEATGLDPRDIRYLESLEIEDF